MQTAQAMPQAPEPQKEGSFKAADSCRSSPRLPDSSLSGPQLPPPAPSLLLVALLPPLSNPAGNMGAVEGKGQTVLESPDSAQLCYQSSMNLKQVLQLPGEITFKPHPSLWVESL